MQDARGCLLELEQLAAAGPGGKRSVLLDRVTDLFFLTSQQQSAAENAVFGEVIERIATEHGQDRLHALSSRTELSSAITDVIVMRGIPDPRVSHSASLRDKSVPRR